MGSRASTRWLGLVLATIGRAQDQCAETTFAPADVGPGDRFSFDLDVEGKVLVAGAPWMDEGAFRSGAAYIYERTSGAWSMSSKITSGDPIALQGFGSSVATNGTEIMIQTLAHSASGAPPTGGSTVDVFRRQAGTWVLTQSLYDALNPGGVDNFGLAIHMDADRAFVSRPRGLHVLEKQSGQWVEVQLIVDQDLPANFQTQVFDPLQVDVDGTTMVVTQRNCCQPAIVFEFGSGTWAPVTELVSPGNVFEDSPVSLSGNTAVIGVERQGNQRGAVWLYERDSNGIWSYAEQLQASDSAPLSRFGSDVDLIGDRLVVGASAADDSGVQNSGAIYVFERSNSIWRETARLDSADLVELGGLGHRAMQSLPNRVIASKPGFSVTLPYTGSVHEFVIPIGLGSPVGLGNTNSTGQPALLFAEGSATIDHDCVRFSIESLPPSQFGYLLMSSTQDHVPLFGGSQGDLHIGLPIVRFSGDILSSGAAGSAAFQPDLGNLPQNTVVAPGETWTFQMWYRDQNPGPTSNTTNGLAITFTTPGYPSVQFPVTLRTVEEEATQIEVLVTLSQSAEHDVTVPWSTSGTATENVDWRVEEDNPFVIVAGETTFSMTVTLGEDLDQEGDETAIVQLGMPAGGCLGTAATFTLTIGDDD